MPDLSRTSPPVLQTATRPPGAAVTKNRQRACSSSCAQRTPTGCLLACRGWGWRWTARCSRRHQPSQRANAALIGRLPAALAAPDLADGARRIKVETAVHARGVQVDQRAADAVTLGFQRQRVDRADFQRRAQHPAHRPPACASARFVKSGATASPYNTTSGRRGVAARTARRQLSATHGQIVHAAAGGNNACCSVPCTSTTCSLPARWCRPSIFWVSTLTVLPCAASQIKAMAGVGLFVAGELGSKISLNASRTPPGCAKIVNRQHISQAGVLRVAPLIRTKIRDAGFGAHAGAGQHRHMAGAGQPAGQVSSAALASVGREGGRS